MPQTAAAAYHSRRKPQSLHYFHIFICIYIYVYTLYINTCIHILYNVCPVAEASADHRNQAPPEGMLAAINSLPSYVQQSHVFVILAPALPHANRSNLVCDLSSWLGRGWCNLEFLSSCFAPFEQDAAIGSRQ